MDFPSEETVRSIISELESDSQRCQNSGVCDLCEFMVFVDGLPHNHPLHTYIEDIIRISPLGAFAFMSGTKDILSKTILIGVLLGMKIGRSQATAEMTDSILNNLDNG